MARRIHMGTLARPHGIKGEICVDWYADSPSLLDGPFWLQAGDAPPRPARARSWRMHKGRPLLLLEGVTDRNDIEALRGQKILVDRDLLPPVDEDEVYVEDVLGFAVILPDGSRLGVLDHVEYPAGLEVWSIVTDDGKAACAEIDRVADRGSTILQGHGGYGGQPKDVVLCACSNKQLYEIEHAVQAIDPGCFIIMLQSNEVHGEGFRQLELGKSESSESK